MTPPHTRELHQLLETLPPEERERRLRDIQSECAPKDGEEFDSPRHREALALLRIEAAKRIAVDGRSSAERSLARKWRADAAAVRRGADALALAYAISARQALATARRSPRVFVSRPGRRQRRAAQAPRPRRSTPPAGADDSGGSDADGRTPARSPHDQAKGPSRMDAADQGARHG